MKGRKHQDRRRFEYLIKTKARGPEVIEALTNIASDMSLGFTQSDVIRYLGSLGAEAKPALGVLRSIYNTASRPVTMDDFREQQEFAGDVPSLMAPISEKVLRGDPLDFKLMKLTEEVIKKIEKS